jgi:hypothetical protein
MMKYLIIMSFLVSMNVWPQDADPLKVERENILKDKQENEAWEKQQQDILKLSHEALKSAQDQQTHFKDLSENYPQYVKQVTQEVEGSLQGLPLIKRMASKKSAFYRCVNESLNKIGSAQIAGCKTLHTANFSPDEELKLKQWENLASLNQENIKSKLELLKNEIALNEGRISNANKVLVFANDKKERIQNAEISLKRKEYDLQVIKENSAFVNCDGNTPDISLEEKVPYPGAKFQGPFVNIPRDNQDGLGTCYANTAKNLLVGTSQGESVASFLDLALLFKDSPEALIATGLDGGLSCSVLKKVNQQGFCPQALAPFETGDKNLFTEGLMGENIGSVSDEAALITLVRKFLAGEETLQKSNLELSERMQGQAQLIIENIKSRPDLALPLPIVRFAIPGDWKIKEAYQWVVKKQAGSNEKQFCADYKTDYQKFYPIYLKAVMDGKNVDQVFDLFQENMKDFIDKYKLQSELQTWKYAYTTDTEADFKNPNLNKSLTESMDFLKMISGKKEESNEEFFETCVNQNQDLTIFLANFQPLIKHLNNRKVNTDILFDKSGKLKSAKELMQLIVAPACIDINKRQKLNAQIHCEDGYSTIRDLRKSGKNIEEQKTFLREKIVASLIQGYPLGNTFDHHINTIVGMRFNKQSNQCEFKIRESQTGTSGWHDEAKIFKSIEALTEVRRK